MAIDRQDVLGSVVALWRYPVKSMMGEELNAADLTEHGVVGDRAYAVVDRVDGKVASAKNPRKWPRLFDYRAAFVDAPQVGGSVPPVRITLPDGSSVLSEQETVNAILSAELAREVTLSPAAATHSAARQAEEYWPDMEGLDYRDAVTDFDLPEGTFFDIAVVHILTTATLDRLRELYPAGRFEVRRFRPNIVLQTEKSTADFVENAWIGCTLAIGETVRLAISEGCPRCVMTTLPQGDLPADPGILRTAAQHNQVHVGVYASVLRGGRIRRGDAVNLE
jgi:uncharacterized protein